MPYSILSAFSQGLRKPQVEDYIYKVLEGTSSQGDVEEHRETLRITKTARFRSIIFGVGLFALWIFTASLFSFVIPDIPSVFQRHKLKQFIPESE
jgi:hypothetical protein